VLTKSDEVGGVLVRTPLSQPIRGSGAPPAEHEFDASYTSVTKPVAATIWLYSVGI